MKYQLDELRSICLINRNGSFFRIPLPREIQYSSVHAIHANKGDRGNTFYFGGNNHQIKPQFGRQDASMGWKMNLTSQGDTLLFGECVPLHVEGQIKLSL